MKWLEQGFYYMTEIVKEWLKFAKMDFDTANHMYKTYHPIPVEIVCFHSEQCAEKSIKALIIHLDATKEIPKTHDLSELLKMVESKTEVSADKKDYANNLTPYAVTFRYPNNDELTENDAKNALQYTESIYNWANSIINEI